jgi:hypothetical protein
MNKDTGGPAFASGAVRKARARPGDPGSDFIVTAREEPFHPGMALRDYCAIRAMEAIIAKCGAYEPISDDKTHATVSKLAYKFADAMIKESQP